MTVASWRYELAGWEEAPTEAAWLVIDLLPAGKLQPAPGLGRASLWAVYGFFPAGWLARALTKASPRSWRKLRGSRSLHRAGIGIHHDRSQLPGG